MTHELSPHQRRELLEMAQRLEALIGERAAADEPSMIARLDQALADVQAAAANKAALEAKLANEAAVRLGSPRAEREEVGPDEPGSADPIAQQFIASTLKLAIARQRGEDARRPRQVQQQLISVGAKSGSGTDAGPATRW
jgi:hypothetical protein